MCSTIPTAYKTCTQVVWTDGQNLCFAYIASRNRIQSSYISHNVPPFAAADLVAFSLVSQKYVLKNLRTYRRHVNRRGYGYRLWLCAIVNDVI